jgi:nucleoid-associated protein YgaU
MALEKAVITNTVTLDTVPVLFNPEEYTINKDINYAQSAIPGLSGPILQFVNGNMSTLEMELLVDTLEAHEEGPTRTQAGEDVRNLTGKITDLMAISSTTHAPPVLIFTWGSLSFTCVLARCSQKFIMFRPDGTPVRARLTVAFNEYLDPEREAKLVNRLTADYSKRVIVLQGDTLSRIAARLYQDPRLWRPIAIQNKIADPRQIRPGQQLLVPSLPFIDPQSGERFG